DLLDDNPLCEAIIASTSELHFDRRVPARVVRTLAHGILRDPPLARRVAASVLTRVWRMKADLIAARSRVSKLSFFVHDFMDACRLEGIGSTRVPSWQSLSMGQSRCAYTMPSATPSFSSGDQFWDPLSGQITSGQPTGTFGQPVPMPVVKVTPSRQ